MTLRQKLLKIFYPALMWLRRIKAHKKSSTSSQGIDPVVSFYSLKGTLIDGKEYDYSGLKGKKILLVNTASDCGFTQQYADLETLYKNFNEQLVVIAFPSNDFKNQESGTDTEIDSFCKRNYGVSFPLMKKSVVIKSPEQNEVFKWLTDPAKNGWNSKVPSWNFFKYYISEDGILLHYFAASVSPLSDEIQRLVRV